MRECLMPSSVQPGFCKDMPERLPQFSLLGKQGYLHVVYRELDRTDGFIITAFIARKVNKRAIIWPKKR
jgi:hypothetical protein